MQPDLLAKRVVGWLASIYRRLTSHDCPTRSPGCTSEHPCRACDDSYAQEQRP